MAASSPIILQNAGRHWVRTALALDTIVRIHVVSHFPQAMIEQAVIQAIKAIEMVEEMSIGNDQPDGLTKVPSGVNLIWPRALRTVSEAAERINGLNSNVSSRAMLRDVAGKPNDLSIPITRSLGWDLTAVAQGLAVDLVVERLMPLEFWGFFVQVGGCGYASGHDSLGRPWTVGVSQMTLAVTDRAICSMGVEKDPRPSRALSPTSGIASVTVLGPGATQASAYAAAIVTLGPQESLALLEAEGLDGVIVTDRMEELMTVRMRKYRYEQS